MGGAPRIIRRVISKPKPPPPASPIAERRVEVQKQTEASATSIVKKY